MPKTRGVNKLILIGLSVLTLIGCGGGAGGGGGSGDNSNSGNEEYSGQNLEGGAVTAVELNSGNQATINFGTVSDSSEYILSVYSYNESGSTGAYQMGSLNSFSNDMNALRTLTADRADVTEDLHEWLRNQENGLDPSLRIDSESGPAKALRAVEDPALGSTRNFKVLNSFGGSSSYSTVTAELVYKTGHFLAYIDQRNVDSLSSSDLDDLLGTFDGQVEKEQALLGGNESDVNDDGRFAVLFTQEVNELGASSGGIVTGFFYAADLLNYPQSNMMEIVYTFVPDPNGQFGTTISKEFSLSNIHPGVLPHEYQHMISFNEHYFENDGSPETSAVNEGMSHLMEDIYSLNGQDYMTTTGIENPARIEGYLASTDSLCITCGASLYQRGGIYLFLRYLYEQAQKGNLTGASSGADFLQKMINTSKTGVDNIVSSALGGSPSASRFSGLFGQFALALFMDDTGLSGDARLSIDGINLRSSQNDNRGTVLQGPAINTVGSFPAVGTIAGASVSYVKLMGSEINGLGGTVSLEVSSSAEAGAYLVQTGL